MKASELRMEADRLEDMKAKVRVCYSAPHSGQARDKPFALIARIDTGSQLIVVG